jgi:hypothetical protein
MAPDKVAGLIEFQVLETPFPKLLTYCIVTAIEKEEEIG